MRRPTMRSTWILGAATLATALLLFGCGGGGDSASSSDAPARTYVSVGTAPVGGAFFVVGGAIAEVLNEFGDDQGWEATAEATKGSQENIRRLASGDLDLAMCNSAISYFAVRGAEGWDREYPIRTVMTLAPNVAMFIAPADGEVKTIADLPDKRVYLGPDGAGFEYFVRPLVEAHGVSLDDFRAVYGTQAAAVNMLADGSVDVAFIGGAVPTGSVVQASTSQDIYFVPFADEAKAKLVNDYLFFRPATIPAGTYRNQDEDYNGLDVGSMHLITRADADEELVYQLTKTIYENREAVTAKHRAGRAINPKNVVRDTGTPFHEGAIRYYREIGIWPEESAAE